MHGLDQNRIWCARRARGRDHRLVVADARARRAPPPTGGSPNAHAYGCSRSPPGWSAPAAAAVPGRVTVAVLGAVAGLQWPIRLSRRRAGCAIGDVDLARPTGRGGPRRRSVARAAAARANPDRARASRAGRTWRGI
jgi:hypothetical protein